MLTDEELLDGYDADQKFRNLLPETLKVRRRYLRKLSREIGFANVTEQKLIRWLTARDIAPKTVSMWISNINAFYIFCLKADEGRPAFPPNEDGTPFNPVTNISKPKLHPRYPRPMAKEDQQKAIENADAKLRCWILLGKLAGLRCMEIAGLQRSDVREETNVLHVIGKGSKERFIPMHPEVWKSLQELPLPTDGPLWSDNADAVSRKGNRYLHSLGIKSTMHTLRHAFGTAVYQRSQDLRATQELMGHSSPQTTAGYAAADQSKSAGIVNGLAV